MSNIIITINRESGSGGREVAYRLGEMLGLKVYDKAILECLSEKYNLNQDEIERIKAKRTNFWDDFCQFYRQFSVVGEAYQPEDKKVTSRELYYAEAAIMRNLAEQESCIIVGRSAFHVFKDNPEAMRVFIIAKRDIRIKKVALRDGIDEKAAAKQIDETDIAREKFTKNFTGVSRYDARNYDITINVGSFSTEAVAAFLAENIRRKMNMNK